MSNQDKPSFIESIKYNFSRWLSYLFISSFLFLTGTKLFTPFFKKSMAAVLLFSIIFFSFLELKKQDVFLKKVLLKFQIKLLKITPHRYRSVIIGLFTGLFPCGLLYTAYAASLILPTIYSSVLNISAFWIGTVPALALTHFAGSNLVALLPQRLKPYLIQALALVSCIIIIAINF